MPGQGFVTHSEYQKHIRGEWRTVHNLWPHIRKYVPGWGYSKAEIDAMFVGTEGSIAFADASGFIAEDNANLFWDAGNDRLGVGTGAPVCTGHFRGAVCADYAGLHPGTVLLIENDVHAYIQLQGATNANAGILFADDDFNPPAGMVRYDFANDWIEFGVGGNEILQLKAGPTFDYAGTLTLDGIVAIAGASINLENNAEIRFYDNGNYVGFQAPALTGDQIWILPDDDGGAGEAIVTDGAGNLSFASVADEKVKVDAAATADYIGAASNDGVLRTGTSMTYVDGGDFVTLNTIQDIRTTASPTFAGLTITGTINGLYVAMEADDNVIITDVVPPNLAGAVKNTVIGKDAGEEITSGDENVLIGYGAGAKLTTALSNVFIGNLAAQFAIVTGSQNVCIGDESGFTLSSGTNNMTLGYQAGYWIGTNSYNTYIGAQAGYNNRGGGNNVSIGYRAGWGEGVAYAGAVNIGHAAGQQTNTGGYNVNIGASAGYWTEQGIGNVCVGRRAGQGVTNQSHSYNVAIGYDALLVVSTGSSIVSVGREAGKALTSGGDHVLIGDKAGLLLTTETGCVMIGHDAGGNATASNVLYIANSNTATPLIYGEFPNALLKVQATNFNVIGTTNLGDGGVTNYASIATDGTITLVGTARVTKLIILSTSYLERGNTAPDFSIDGSFISWAYNIGDDSVMTHLVPDDWAVGTNIIIKVHWFIDEAYAADKEVKWQCLYALCPHDETEAIDAPTHSGTLTSVSQNIPAVAKRLTETTIGTIVAANISAGDEIGLTLSRIAQDNDAPTADPQVVHLEISYTANKIGT